MDDKVKIRCPGCKQVFSERMGKVRDGVQVNCQHCNKLLTLNRESDDPYIRRALKTAKEMRDAQETKVAAAIYSGSGSAPPR